MAWREGNARNIKESKISKIVKNSEYVFTFNGEPVTDIHKGFTQAVEQAGIEGFRFHDLRHTFASHLVMNGATIKDLMELLGHKDDKPLRTSKPGAQKESG